MDILNKIDSEKYDEYILYKENRLQSIQNNINYWNNIYNVFFDYSNIQTEIYVKVKNILNINNFSVDLLKSRILLIVNKFTEYNNILLQIESNVLSQTNIEEFITNFNNVNNLSISEIKTLILNEIDKKYENLVNYLKYYYKNKIYYQKI